MLASDSARLLEGRGIDGAYHRFRISQSPVQDRQNLVAPAPERLRLVAQGLHLLRRKLPPLQIAHQTVGAPGNVHDMEARRAEAVRRVPKLLRRQAFGELRQILARLLKCIENGADERMNAGDGPA